MGYLSRNDVTRVLECAEGLYTGTATGDFTHHAVKAASLLVPADTALYVSVDYRKHILAFVPLHSRMLPPTFMEEWQPYLHYHVAHYRQAMKYLPPPPRLKVRFNERCFRLLDEGRAVNIGLAESRREYHNSVLYNELFKRIGIEYQLGVSFVHTESRVEAIAFTRSGLDFSERERKMLDILGPHFRQCFEKHRMVAAMRDRAAGPAAGNLCSLAEQYRLTDREAEVLHWVAQGKTNDEIATILGMATRTVKKHLERVFQKLGVENRTSAALMAMEMNTAGK